jgi:hypothetical protein
VEVIGPNFSVLVNTGHNAALFQLSRSVTIKTFSLAHRCRSFVPRGAQAWQLFDGRHGAGGSLGAGFNSNAGGFGGGPGANGGPPGQGRRPTMGSIRPGFSAELQWVQRKQRAIPPSLRAMEDHGWQKRARGRLSTAVVVADSTQQLGKAPVKVLQATGKSSRPPPSLEVVEQRKCCHSSGRQGRKGRIHKIRL